MTTRHNRVLVAPLEWGLGHFTRCIPVIRELRKQGAEVVIAGRQQWKVLLLQFFAELEFVEVPGIRVRYPKHIPMSLAMMMQLPSMLHATLEERKFLKRLIKDRGLTHVISDNRFGMYADEIPSVIMTHQVHICAGKNFRFLEPALFIMNRYWIEHFDLLWIPDWENDRLAGKLSGSEGIRIQSRFIGMLSRFNQTANNNIKEYDIIALLSGPESQRTEFENQLLNLFASSGKKCLLIQGKPGANETRNTGNTQIISAISDDDLKRLLHPETLLICRPGYSTLMDLTVLGHTKIVFVPTPGQTEQEYLSEHISRTNGFTIVSQGKPIPLENTQAGKAFPFRPGTDQHCLELAIAEFLQLNK